MVILSWPELASEAAVYKDVIAADLHFAADFFKSFGGSKGAVLAEDYRAVMLASEGDTFMQGAPKYSLAVVSNGHPLFRGKATPISTEVKVPMVTCRYNTTLTPLSSSTPDKEWSPHKNPPALAMNLDISTLSKNWVCVDKTVWPKNSVGYILVGKEDGRDVTEKHVEVIAEFCIRIQHLFLGEMREELGLEGGEKSATRLRFVQEHVNKKKFEKFFKVYKEKRSQNGDRSWDKTVCPS